MGLHQVQSTDSKRNNKMKRQPRMGENFLNHMSDKGANIQTV